MEEAEIAYVDRVCQTRPFIQYVTISVRDDAGGARAMAGDVDPLEGNECRGTRGGGGCRGIESGERVVNVCECGVRSSERFDSFSTKERIGWPENSAKMHDFKF